MNKKPFETSYMKVCRIVTIQRIEQMKDAEEKNEDIFKSLRKWKPKYGLQVLL